MYTVDDLIEDIRIRGAIPNSQSLFTPARYVSLLTGEMRTLVVPQIMSVREDYFLAFEDQAITSELFYEIPERAIGGKLSSIYIVDSTGREVTKLNPSTDRIIEVGSSSFYMQNNKIKINEGNVGRSLRMYYYRRSNDLVPNVSAGQVSSIDSGANTMVLGNVPTTWEVGSSITVIKGKPGFDTLVEATPITSLSSPTVGIASVDGISVGDWIALEGKSPIPQIPVEAHPVLSQAVVVKCMETMGDRNGMASAQSKLEQLQQDMFFMLNPRVDESPKKVVSRRGIFGYGTITTRDSFSRRS